MLLVDSLLEEVFLPVEGTRNASLFFGVLEVDNIMRFDLLEIDILLVRAMLDELPQTLALVLVHDGDSAFFWFLDGRPVPHVLPALISLWELVELVVGVEVDALVVFCEVHEAVREDVVDEQLIVEVDVVSIVLVGAVGVDLPNDL